MIDSFNSKVLDRNAGLFLGSTKADYLDFVTQDETLFEMKHNSCRWVSVSENTYVFYFILFPRCTVSDINNQFLRLSVSWNKISMDCMLRQHAFVVIPCQDHGICKVTFLPHSPYGIWDIVVTWPGGRTPLWVGGWAAGQTSFVSALTSVSFFRSFANLARTFFALRSHASSII